MSMLKRCLKFTVEKNFLYLVSALLVLIGSFQFMVDADSAGLSEFSSTILLIVILQVYEVLLAGVCYSVYRKLAIEHDGLMLAIISLLMIFDPTFFNNRLYMCAPSIWQGLAANVLLLGLALGKLYVLIHQTKVPLSKRYERVLQFIMAAIYCGPFLFHYSAPLTKVSLLSILFMTIPLIPFMLPRPRPSKAKGTKENLHFRFERYLFFLASFIIPLHLYELSIIYDLPWSMGIHNHSYYSSSALTVLPWSATLFAPLLVTFGIVLMKTTRIPGLNGEFHKWLAIASLGVASFSRLNFANLFSGSPLFTPFTLQLVTVALYMIITWSVTGKEHHLWHAQLAIIALFGGTSINAIALSIVELNPLMLTVFVLNIGLWSLFRGTAEDHRNSMAAGTILLGRGIYSFHGFTFIYNVCDSVFTVIGHCLEWILSSVIRGISHICRCISSILETIFNGAGGHKGTISLTGAFILLLGGFYVSMNKEALMTNMSNETDEENAND